MIQEATITNFLWAQHRAQHLAHLTDVPIVQMEKLRHRGREVTFQSQHTAFPIQLSLPDIPPISHYLSDTKKVTGQETESFKMWPSTLGMSTLKKGHQKVIESGLRYQKCCHKKN